MTIDIDFQKIANENKRLIAEIKKDLAVLDKLQTKIKVYKYVNNL